MTDMTESINTTESLLQRFTHIRWDTVRRTFVWFSLDGGTAPLPISQMLALLNEAMAAGYGAEDIALPPEGNRPYDVYFHGTGWFSAIGITDSPVSDTHGQRLLKARHPHITNETRACILTPGDFGESRVAFRDAMELVPDANNQADRERNSRHWEFWTWSGDNAIASSGTILFYRFAAEEDNR